MVHIATRSPLSATIAVITAGAIMLGTNTIESPKPSMALTAPTIAAQAVHLTALAGPLPPARAANVSDDLAKVGEVLQNIPKAIFLGPVAGAGAGTFLGFIGGGILAVNLLQALVPEQFYDVVSPIIPVVAVLGAIIGAPIGAVVGPIISAASLLNTLSPSNASATASARMPAAAGVRSAVDTPHRTSPPRARPQRSSLTEPSASSADPRKAVGRASTRNAAVASAAATRALAPSQRVATSHSTAHETPQSEHRARSARVARD